MRRQMQFDVIQSRSFSWVKSRDGITAQSKLRFLSVSCGVLMSHDACPFGPAFLERFPSQ